MEEDLKNVHLPFFGIPKLFPYLKKYRKRIVFMVALGILTSLIDASFPLFNRYAIDHFIAEGILDTMPLFIGLYMGLLLLQVSGVALCRIRPC